METATEMQADIDIQKHLSIFNVILQVIPTNIIDAFHGQMLGLIFFSLIFGYALSKIEPQPLAILVGFWQGVSNDVSDDRPHYAFLAYWSLLSCG